MRKVTLIKLIATLGVVVFIGYSLINKVDLKVAYNLAAAIPTYYFVIFIILSSGILVIKSFAYHLLLKRVKVDVTLFQSIKIFFSSQLVTPLPGGEAGRVLITLRETDASGPEAAGSVVSQAFLEIFAAVIVALFGSLFFNLFRIPAIFSLGVLSILVSLLFSQKVWETFLKLITKIKMLDRRKVKLVTLHKSIRTNIFMRNSKMPNRSFTSVLGLLLLGQIIGGLLIYFICKALNIDLAFLKCLFLYSSTVLLQGLLSVLPGGVGTTEGGLSGLLLSLGVALNKSVAIIIVFRLVTLILYLLYGLLFFALFYNKLLLDIVFKKSSKKPRKL